MIVSPVKNIFNGVGVAYIYIWLSKRHKVVYVGMTNRYSGTIGRADGHFNHGGTFRKRFLQARGYPIEQADDMVLLSFPLPRKSEYISVERSYREAVEFLVHKELLIIRGSLVPTFDVVAWVRDVPKRTGNTEVIGLAQNIIQSFTAAYPSL